MRPFTDADQTLETFADQAVIAIENVRLFKELDERTNELARSVGELKALGEVGQAVSSTLDLETVLSSIVARGPAHRHRLRSIYEYDEPPKSLISGQPPNGRGAGQCLSRQSTSSRTRAIGRAA